MTTDWGPDRALYGISVAAELTGVNPQMLRTYEAKGLLEPQRTDGGTRRYSGADLVLVNRITTLLAAGLNLAGIDHVLQLEAQNRRLHTELDALRHHDQQPAQSPQPPRQRRKDRKDRKDRKEE